MTYAFKPAATCPGSFACCVSSSSKRFSAATLASSHTLGLEMALCLGVGKRLAQGFHLTSKGCEEVLEKRLPFQSSSHATGVFGFVVSARHSCDEGYGGWSSLKNEVRRLGG